MELNRAVCFEYPDACVPWFHQYHINTVIANSKKLFTSSTILQESKFNSCFIEI